MDHDEWRPRVLAMLPYTFAFAERLRAAGRVDVFKGETLDDAMAKTFAHDGIEGEERERIIRETRRLIAVPLAELKTEYAKLLKETDEDAARTQAAYR